MKIVRLACADGVACQILGCPSGDIVGLCLLFEDEIGEARGESEKYLVDVNVASLWHLLAVVVEVVRRGSALLRLRIAGLLAMVAFCSLLLQIV